MKKKVAVFVFTALFALAALVGCGKADTLKIVKQPATDFEVAVSEGFTLTVGVNDESLVKSYRWQTRKGNSKDGYEWVDLKGDSARKKTLLNPCVTSFDGGDGELCYRCLITDVNDVVFQTETSVIRVTDADKFVDLITVGGYPLKAGKTIDLASVGLGKGTVSLNEAGDEAVFENAVLNLANSVCDYTHAFNMTFNDYQSDTFTVKINGENSIISNCGVDYNLFNFDFRENSKCENVVFEGDGLLSLAGGKTAINANTRVTVECDMIFGKMSDEAASGISAYDIIVTDGVRIDADLNGFLFKTVESEKMKEPGGLIYGQIVIENGAVINLTTSAPAQKGRNDFYGIAAAGCVSLRGATVNMMLVADGKRFPDGHSINSLSAIFSKGEISLFDGSRLNITVSSSDHDKNFIYSATIMHVFNNIGKISIIDSEVSIKGDLDDEDGGMGAVSAPAVEVIRGNLDIDISSKGDPIAIESWKGIRESNRFLIADSYVRVRSRSTDGRRFLKYCVYANGFEMTGDSTLDIDTDGVALAIFKQVGTIAPFDKNYKPTVLDKYDIFPSDAVINRWYLDDVMTGCPQYETVYAKGETENPIGRLIIKTKS